MGNKIKLRRQALDPIDIARYRDYPGLIKRHERTRRRKRFVRFFTFSLLITLIVLLFLIIISYLWFRLEKKRDEKGRRIQKAKIETPIIIDPEFMPDYPGSEL